MATKTALAITLVMMVVRGDSGIANTCSSTFQVNTSKQFISQNCVRVGA
jgi:hypothetical protein